jgi:DNA-binding NarL/FixJ family response regulator
VDRIARVFIVDDHPIVRQGLTAMINHAPDLAVCGEACTPEAAESRIAVLLPDLVIVDLSLGQHDGTQLIRVLRERFAGLPVLVVTMHDEAHIVHQAVQSGASGYLTKREAAEKVLVAIRALLDGKTYFGEKLAGRLRGQPSSARRRIGNPPDLLSAREQQVFLLIGRGLTTRRIAGELEISPKTVETHYERIKRKLALVDLIQLTRAAMHWVLHRDEH